MLVHSHPPRPVCFIKWQTNELSGNIVGTTNIASFWSLRMAWISAFITGMWVFKFSLISLRQGSFQVFPWSSLSHLLLYCSRKESEVSTNYQVYTCQWYFRGLEHDHHVSQWVQWTHLWAGSVLDSICSWVPMCTLPNKDPWWCFGSPGISANSDPVFNSPLKVWLFPFLQFTITWV